METRSDPVRHLLELVEIVVVELGSSSEQEGARDMLRHLLELVELVVVRRAETRHRLADPLMAEQYRRRLRAASILAPESQVAQPLNPDFLTSAGAGTLMPAPFRGRSSDGRALQSHCRGQGFDSPRLHQIVI